MAAEALPLPDRALARVDQPLPGFDETYRALFADLAGYCLALTRDEPTAHDVAQESFVRLFLRWKSVRDPKAFLFVTATNLVRDDWRRQRYGAQLLGRIVGRFERHRPDHVEVLELRDVVDRLAKPLRDVVVVRHFADLTVEDTARALGLPAGTVKRRLSEAREQLRADWITP